MGAPLAGGPLVLAWPLIVACWVLTRGPGGHRELSGVHWPCWYGVLLGATHGPGRRGVVGLAWPPPLALVLWPRGPGTVETLLSQGPGQPRAAGVVTGARAGVGRGGMATLGGRGCNNQGRGGNLNERWYLAPPYKYLQLSYSTCKYLTPPVSTLH